MSEPTNIKDRLRTEVEYQKARDGEEDADQRVYLAWAALEEIERLELSLTASGDDGWRTVESGMPPLNQWVLIFTGGPGSHGGRVKKRQYVAMRKEFGRKQRSWIVDDDDDWGVQNCSVTHWKPLQENPK